MLILCSQRNVERVPEDQNGVDDRGQRLHAIGEKFEKRRKNYMYTVRLQIEVLYNSILR